MNISHFLVSVDLKTLIALLVVGGVIGVFVVILIVFVVILIVAHIADACNWIWRRVRPIRANR